MQTAKIFCFVLIMIFTSVLCLKSVVFAQDVESVFGYWKSVETLPPYGENDYFFIEKNSFSKRKQKPTPIKITEKDNCFVFTVSEGKMKGMPFAKIKPIGKDAFLSIRGKPVEFKRITKDEYEHEISKLR